MALTSSFLPPRSFREACESQSCLPVSDSSQHKQKGQEGHLAPSLQNLGSWCPVLSSDRVR